MISRTLTQIAANQSLLPWMTCMGLVIFLGFFVGVLVWTTLKRNRALYQSMSEMPFEDEVNS